MTRKELATILTRLAGHFPPRNIGAGMVDSVLEDWLTDVGHLPAGIIDMACAKWRRDKENRWFPTPGQLLEICNAHDVVDIEMIRLQRIAAEKRRADGWE